MNRLAVGAMNDLLAHRGPDGEGLWVAEDERVVLGHRRLAIIDPTPAGDQPMCDPGGRLVLTFNGEIYNYLELADRLRAEGRSFRSASDSEVLMAAYEVWGEAGLAELNGMFAFALYDRREGILFCARDRFGEKPFLYSATDDYFAFASEYKALLALSEVSSEIDVRRLLTFLHQPRRGLDDSPETVFDGVRQLLPGECLRIDARTLDLTVRRYWTPDADPGASELTEADAVERFKALLADSVRIRMRSDVPVGSCLSGGLDSGSIVCLNRQAIGDGPAYHVFTGRFPGTPADEWSHAKTVIDAADVTSHVVEPDPVRLASEMPAFIWHNELPVGSTSQYAQWCVFRLARDHGVTVLLDGQGADEMLAGYEQYFGPYLKARAACGGGSAQEDAAIRERYPAALLSPGQSWRAKLPRQLRHVLANALGRGSDFTFGLTRDALALIDDPDGGQPASALNPLSAALHEDTFHAHLPTLLRYGDRNSMAHSREVRLPFCDHRIAELVLALPPQYLMGGAQTKRLLREAMRGILPEPVRTRWNKQGFLPPQSDWFQGALLSWARDTFASQAFQARGYWNTAWWRRIMDRFVAGEAHLAWPLWKPLVAEAWRNDFVDRVRAMPSHSVFAAADGSS